MDTLFILQQDLCRIPPPTPAAQARGGFSAESKMPQDRQKKKNLLVATAIYAATAFHLTSEVAFSVFSHTIESFKRYTVITKQDPR